MQLSSAHAACPRRRARTRTSFVDSWAIRPPSTLVANRYVNGTIFSKGGPFHTDRFGRVVVLHGVNAVYKLPPYTLSVTPGHVNSLDDRDAALMNRLGFNVVRLGIIWQEIEPGRGGPNQAKVCRAGPSSDPGMWSEKVAQSYLDQVAQLVATLGRQHT